MGEWGIIDTVYRCMNLDQPSPINFQVLDNIYREITLKFLGTPKPKESRGCLAGCSCKLSEWLKVRMGPH